MALLLSQEPRARAGSLQGGSASSTPVPKAHMLGPQHVCGNNLKCHKYKGNQHKKAMLQPRQQLP